MNSENIDQSLEELLQFLKTSRGFDFTDYKRPSLNRRLSKRMQEVGCETFRAYMDYLEVHQSEFTELFNTLLINVTSFFRNPAAWQSLATTVIPKILQNKGADDSVRVWTAACASGEETYTVAILLAEAMGADAFARRVKIYATDIDEDALAKARQASYTSHQIADVPEPLREKYFESMNGRFVFRADLRRSIIFGRHNLVQDASISRLDLLICRNTLMYFNAELQSRIVTRFHFGLSNPGYLFLGKAEMLLTQSELFKPVEIKHRLFEKVVKSNLRERLLMLAQNSREELLPQSGGENLLAVAFDTQPEAQLVVDRQGILVLADQKARTQFNIASRDIGRPLQDLEVSFRPVDLRSLLNQAYKVGQPVVVTQVERHRTDGEAELFDITIVPFSEDDLMIGASVTYHDVTNFQRLHKRLQQTNEALETASEELHSTNEELETTNEELQSTVEELETTNEELQSANEEMETMNEELQAANSEMEAVNNELNEHKEQVNRSKMFLQSILTSLQCGVIVLDRDFRVTSWNNRSFELWGLREEEVLGRSLLGLDIGLPVHQLVDLVNQCLEKQESGDTRVSCTSRRGKAIRCRVMCSPLKESGKGATEGVILLVDELAES